MTLGSGLDPADFALACIEGKPLDVRRIIFDQQDAGLLAGALHLIEEQDGDERLRSWITLRLGVLRAMAHTEQVLAGAATPMQRRKPRVRPVREQAQQVSFLAPVAPPVPEVKPPAVQEADPLDCEGVEETGPLVTVAAEDPDVVQPVAQRDPVPAQPRPVLIDPRPSIFLGIPDHSRKPLPFLDRCAEVTPGLLWLLRVGRKEDGRVRVRRADLQRMARSPDTRAGARWALGNLHRLAWAEESPLETIAALYGLTAGWDRGDLILSARERGS